jgi:hypothetical protein
LQLVGGDPANVRQEVDFDQQQNWVLAGVQQDFNCDEGVELEEKRAVGRNGVGVELNQDLEQPLPALNQQYIL